MEQRVSFAPRGRCNRAAYAFCVHNWTFYSIAKSSAVLAGVNKSVQAISVFAASDYFYCDFDPQQCLSTGKCISMVLVVLGVLLYSYGKPNTNNSDTGHMTRSTRKLRKQQFSHKTSEAGLAHEEGDCFDESDALLQRHSQP